MSKPIFLDFLSPDNWKTYSTVPNAPKELLNCEDILVSQIKQSLNVAVLLTAQYCLLPPAFIIQSRIAFRAVFESSLYLDEKLVYLPLREDTIGQYIDKKVSEYATVKKSHTGFYNERHWEFLSKYQNLLIRRNAPMGATIAKKWIEISDKSNVWRPIVDLIPNAADKLRLIPQRLKNRGQSVTLEATISELGDTNPALPRLINQAIQHEYLKAYIAEFNASILSNAPPKPLNENYLIPIDSCYYDFRLFVKVLDLLGVKDYFLNSKPEEIIRFIRTPEYFSLTNIYNAICEKQSDNRLVEEYYSKMIKATGVSMAPLRGIRLIQYHKVKDRINRIADIFDEKTMDYGKKTMGNKRNHVKHICIIVATDTEYTSALQQFEHFGYKLENDNIEDLYFKKVKLDNGIMISLVRTEMGAEQVGGAFNTTHSVVDLLRPDAIVICGICFGMENGKEPLKIGDILVSTDIWDYETSKISKGIIDHRGKILPVSTSLVQLFRREATTHHIPVYFGLMGAGAKNVDDENLSSRLLSAQPSMIGGDMEGYAVVSVCQKKKLDCILVKAICDWGYNKGDDYQRLASDNSLEFVIKVLGSVKISS